jgi:hypothetical protein
MYATVRSAAPGAGQVLIVDGVVTVFADVIDD